MIKENSNCLNQWYRDKDWEDTFYIVTIIEGYHYRLRIWYEENKKNIKFHVAVSSGKKRKDLEIYEQKDNKSLGGIKALFWIKENIDRFPIWFKKEYPSKTSKRWYMCIGWADSRRRNIYQRLIKEGYYFMQDNKYKMLRKEIKL